MVQSLVRTSRGHGWRPDLVNWGGDNDYTEETGTEGPFQFKYGSPYNQRDYAIAYNDEVGSEASDNGDYNCEVLLVGYGDLLFDGSAFYTEEDGKRTTTHVEIRKTCMVYDGDPHDGGAKLIGASDTTQFAVRISNREATGTTGGEVKPVLGADES